MKRIGNLYERFISLDNCIQAEKRLGRNKYHNRRAKHISENAEKYAPRLQEVLASDSWIPSKNRTKVIHDNVSGKERKLEIANLFDQSVELAWLNVVEETILRRLPYYCCGSMPRAGQSRAYKYMKKLANRYKYCALTDITKFYESIPHKLVMDNLRRIIKDEKFLSVAQKMLDHMGNGEVGVPIGHPISHWFANISLMRCVHALTDMDVKVVQYMDDIAMFSNNKRHLRRALEWLKSEYDAIGFRMKHNYQLFPVKSRKVQYLSYRFFKGAMILKKKIMYRIAKTAKKFAYDMYLRLAQRMMCYYAIMKHCSCYRFREKRVMPYISKTKLRGFISNESKNKIRADAQSV